MKAAWYERQGPAREVLVVGDAAEPEPGAGEVRIRVAVSGINPGDVKKRADAFGVGMAYPRVIPHSDGAGVIDRAGPGVPPERVGERVWCFGAQSGRAFGTAAEWVVVPAALAVALPAAVSFAQGACLGIPGITAHRAVHVGGPVGGRVVLVQGAAGAVGTCAVALARFAGARVIATVRSEAGERSAAAAGAHEVLRLDRLGSAGVAARCGGMVDHVVEVDLGANVRLDEAVLAPGGSIAAYASAEADPALPFWPLLFKNISLHLLGSDDFPASAKTEAAHAIHALLVSGWAGFEPVHAFALADIAAAHEAVEGRAAGRVVVQVGAPAG